VVAAAGSLPVSGAESLDAFVFVELADGDLLQQLEGVQACFESFGPD
jgi:hypothetical protein